MEPPSPKELKDVNGAPISRLKRLSVSLGFTDSLALQRQTLHLQNGAISPNSPTSPTARRSSHAVAGAYNNMGDPTRRMSRRMTMHAGWDRSRRQGSISHIATVDPNSLPNSPTYAPNHSPTYNRASYAPSHSPSYNRTSFDRNSMVPPRRHQRGSMAPALGNVTEARDSIINEGSVSPTEPASSNAQDVQAGEKDEAAATSSSGPPASPTSPGSPGSHRLKRTRQSQIIRQHPEGNSGPSLGPLDEVDSPIASPARKPAAPSMSATDAALRALEGNPTTPAFPPHDDIPQYLLDAHRRLSTLAPPPPPRAPRAVSPGQRAVRKLKTLSMGAIGRDTSPAPAAAAAASDTNPALQSRFQEEFPVPTASAKKPRSSSRERLGQATRKLKTMSVYVAGREVPPVLELQRSKESAAPEPAAAPDLAEKARSSPRPTPERSGSSNRVSRFLRTQSDLAKERYSPSPRGSERRAFLAREPSSAAAAREHSKYSRASPKPSPKPSAKGQEVDFPDDASIASHHPVKPQHKMVYGVKETTGDAKKGSRLKRFSMNVARLFQ